LCRAPEFFATASLTVAEIKDVPCTFAYPDLPTALAALSSAGPAVRIAEHAGQQAVEDEQRDRRWGFALLPSPRWEPFNRPPGIVHP